MILFSINSAFDRISMAVAIESFDRNGLRAQNDKLIDIPDMTSVLHSLYITIEQIDLPLMLDLAINWILNVYDSQRTGQIRVLSFKVISTINSACHLKLSLQDSFNGCDYVCRLGLSYCVVVTWKRNIGFYSV